MTDKPERKAKMPTDTLASSYCGKEWLKLEQQLVSRNEQLASKDKELGDRTRMYLNLSAKCDKLSEANHEKDKRIANLKGLLHYAQMYVENHEKRIKELSEKNINLKSLFNMKELHCDKCDCVIERDGETLHSWRSFCVECVFANQNEIADLKAIIKGGNNLEPWDRLIKERDDLKSRIAAAWVDYQWFSAHTEMIANEYNVLPINLYERWRDFGRHCAQKREVRRNESV